MFNQYYSGKRIKDIVVFLAEKGIKNNYGKSWTINSVSRVLRNPNYKGCVYADNTCYANIFPAIVSEEIFDEVNNRLKVSKRTSAHFKTDVNYLLSGKLICGKCGGLMTGDSGKGKMGKIYNYYKCFTKKRNKELCDKKSISQEYIEDIVLSATKEFLNHTNLTELSICLADIYNKSIEKDAVLESLNKQLQENNKKLANFVRAMENGIFNDTTNERMKELEIANKDLQEKITSREMLVIKPLDKNVIYSFLYSFKDIDLNNKLACQRLVDMFLNRVVLFDDHCDIYFNTNDDKFKQLKLKEQPDIDGKILFESNKKEQSNHASSDCSLMAEHL